MATETAKKGHLSKPKGKHHESHIRKLDNGFHVTNTHADGTETEHATADQDEAMTMLQDHMNAPPQDPAAAPPAPAATPAADEFAL